MEEVDIAAVVAADLKNTFDVQQADLLVVATDDSDADEDEDEDDMEDVDINIHTRSEFDNPCLSPSPSTTFSAGEVAQPSDPVEATTPVADPTPDTPSRVIHNAKPRREAEQRSRKRTAADANPKEDSKPSRPIPHADAAVHQLPALTNSKSSRVVDNSAPAPSGSAAPARNGISMVRQSYTYTLNFNCTLATAPDAPVQRPAGQKRKRMADDKEDGELSEPEERSRLSASVRKTKWTKPYNKDLVRPPRAPRRTAPAPSRARARPAAPVAAPAPAPTFVSFTSRAVAAAHAKWEERMRRLEKGEAEGARQIRVITTDSTAMAVKPRH
ncbi:hypothetical protein C8Q80DRAFT_378796 [Daedaleopsis nitida]|nr:hypothetical protein C8Q80DRAFT_378796 [Daedaleopsis nitida]